MKQKPPFLILLLLVSFGSVGAVLFTPAIPTIQEFFHITAGQSQLTITTYLVGYALGQLAYGPLANGLGRKKALYIGLILSILGSLLCVASAWLHSFGVLIFGRFVQAIGATAGLKIAYTMVADTYEQTEAAKVISRFVLAFAIMPGIAVTIGGFLTTWFNWESCFYFLALFGLVMLKVSTHLPETAKVIDSGALNPSSIIEGYRLKLKNKHLIISSLMMGCMAAIIYIFAAKTPFIGIKLIGLSPDKFGTYNLIPSIGLVIGSFIAASFIGRFKMMNLIFAGILGTILGALTMFVPFALYGPNSAALFLPMALIYVFQGLVYPNVSSYGLSRAKNKSNASALLNFINISTAVVAVLLSEFILPESALMLPIFFLFFLSLLLLLSIRLKKLEHTA